MYEEKLTLGVKAFGVAACSICRANNFDNDKFAIGERVDKLYELKIGGQVMTLCDKCLDRLREKLTQRINAKEKLEAAGGQIVLFTGTEFTARDKLGQSYRYRMIGAEVTHDGLIRLLNLDTNFLTYVEPEWFRQRKIKVIQSEEAKHYPCFYDEVGGYHEGGCGFDPDGDFCGECGSTSCATCEVWHRKQLEEGQK